MHTASTCTDFTTALVNVGVWGSPNYGRDFLRAETYDAFEKTNRDIEAKVAEVGGMKWLYACNYYSVEELWRIYDKATYEGLRAKWIAERLPNLWEKVVMGQVVRALVYAGLGVDRLVT